MKKKLSGKLNNTTNAVLDKDGKLVTNREEIKQVTVEHYLKVLENRKIREGLEDHRKEREELCVKRIELAKKT